MAEPFLGEIRMFGFNFAPVGWAMCAGQLLPISQYSAVFSLLGTSYGGDGTTSFALPDLRSRIPIHMGSGPGLTPRVIAEVGGEETVTLTGPQLPVHSHTAMEQLRDCEQPLERVLGGAASLAQFVEGTAANENMASGAMGMIGGSSPHDNMVPYLTLNFCIALAGIYPSGN